VTTASNESSRSGASRLPSGLAALAGLLLGTCTTETPPEHFRSVPGPSANNGTGGLVATGGSGGGGAEPTAGGASGSGNSAATGGSSDTGGTSSSGGSSARGGSSNGGSEPRGGSTSGTESGGSGGSSADGQGGTSAVGGSGASASEGGAAGDDGGAPPPDPCGPPPVSSEPFSRQLLRSAAADCSLWHYCRFEAASATLLAKVTAHAEAPSDGRLEAARAAWRSAMDEWSVIELFQFGPLASRSMSAGKDAYQGQGLRERIYSWPNLARCRVDEQVAEPTYDTQGFASVPLTGRGLFGLETLLFYAGSDTACVPASSAAKTWATLDSEEIASRKLSYAQALADNIHAEMGALIALFQPGTGNYRELLVSASGYPSEQEALNTLAWALIYVEREVKDWKLGIPAGYTLMHPVSGPEAPFAGTGTENIRGNLRGFQGLFQGCGANGEGIGFDDWLIAADHPELAADIVAALGVARDAADDAGPLAGLSGAELETLYRAVKGLTDLVKGDLFGPASPLNLELPEGVEGDTD
jgi:uncharacterized protein